MRVKPWKGLPCVKCTIRKQRNGDGLCLPCRDLTRAEGTYDQVALRPDPQKANRKKRVAIIEKYNRLMRKGTPFGEVAALLGMDNKQLSSYLHQSKKIYGLKPVYGKKPDRHHGIAPYGLAKCQCELCRTTRSATRRQQNAAKLAAANMPS